MSSLRNLPVKLSAEDAAVFRGLQASALFPTLALPGEGELVALYKQKQREFQERHLEPYADILETELTKYLMARKDEIYKKLLASETGSFVVELFKWKTIHFRESLTELKRRESTMTPEQLRAHRITRRERDFELSTKSVETTFGVERCEVYDGEEEISHVMYPEKVDKIFRYTDLALRLSLVLGPNFYPFTTAEYVDEECTQGEDGYSVLKKILCVRYYPFGVNKPQMDKLLACAKKQAQRSKKQLERDEYSVGHGSINIWPPVCISLVGTEAAAAAEAAEYSDMPPLIPSQAKRCFCGCSDEE